MTVTTDLRSVTKYPGELLRCARLLSYTVRYKEHTILFRRIQPLIVKPRRDGSGDCERTRRVRVKANRFRTQLYPNAVVRLHAALFDHQPDALHNRSRVC